MHGPMYIYQRVNVVAKYLEFIYIFFQIIYYQSSCFDFIRNSVGDEGSSVLDCAEFHYSCSSPSRHADRLTNAHAMKIPLWLMKRGQQH